MTLASIKFIYCGKYFDGQLMWYKIEKICLPCVNFSVCLIISMKQIMGGLVLMCKCISFLQVCSFFFCWYHCKHIFARKKWALLTGLLNVKNNILHHCVHSKEDGRQIKRVEWCTGNSCIKQILICFKLPHTKTSI